MIITMVSIRINQMFFGALILEYLIKYNLNINTKTAISGGSCLMILFS